MIYEIDFKHFRPFSLTEELTHFTHKIDFLEGESEDDVESGTNEEDLQSENKQDQTKREQQWPWESVRNKLRCTALINVALFTKASYSFSFCYQSFLFHKCIGTCFLFCSETILQNMAFPH